MTDDDSFVAMLNNIRRATEDTVDVAMSMDPGCLIMGMSAETFWDGAEGADRLHARMVSRTGGGPGIMGSTALDAAIKTYGQAGKPIRKIGIITPYMPVGDNNVRRFFEDQGYEVVNIVGLQSPSPMMIAHESAQTLKRAAVQVSEGADAVIQCGTNLAFAQVAAMAEFWLEKPVLAINTATYWHALRSMGIMDQMDGFGRLLAEF